MIPSEKSPEIDNLLDAIGFQRKRSIENNVCAICQKEVDPDMEFRDSLSIKEYTISGMCQKCQDKIFTE